MKCYRLCNDKRKIKKGRGNPLFFSCFIFLRKKKKLKCFFGVSGDANNYEQIERLTSKMNLGNKTEIIGTASKNGKTFMIEEDVPQYYFPTELWDNIKGFMFHPEETYMKRTYTANALDFKRGIATLYYGNAEEKKLNEAFVRKLGKDYTSEHVIILSDSPRWKTKILALCECMLKDAKRSRIDASELFNYLHKGRDYDYAEYMRNHNFVGDAINKDRDIISQFYDVYEKVK